MTRAVVKEAPVRAWRVGNDMDDEGRMAIVPAPSRNEAKASAANTDEVGNYSYRELRAVRAPEFDGLSGDELLRAQLERGWWWECPGGCGYTQVRHDEDREAAGLPQRYVIRRGTAFCTAECCLAWLRGERVKGEEEQLARRRIERRWPRSRVDSLYRAATGQWVADVTEWDGFRSYRGVNGMLTRVTIAGVDDEVPIAELLKLGKEFPFVEWAVLWSETRRGTPRYPELLWVRELAERLSGQCQLAFHLCGEAARRVLAGDSINWTGELGQRGFGRVQLNGFAVASEGLIKRIRATPDVEWVLQLPDDATYRQALRVAAEVGMVSRVTALWDQSGGVGRRGAYWPELALPTSYAGGISSVNVLEILRELPGHAPFGIDLESGVRYEGRFDLDFARVFLETVAPHVRAQP